MVGIFVLALEFSSSSMDRALAVVTLGLIAIAVCLAVSAVDGPLRLRFVALRPDARPGTFPTHWITADGARLELLLGALSRPEGRDGRLLVGRGSGEPALTVVPSAGRLRLRHAGQESDLPSDLGEVARALREQAYRLPGAMEAGPLKVVVWGRRFTQAAAHVLPVPP
jgi:hypothetical protein